MHIPDGFISGGTSLAGGGIAAGGVAVSLKQVAKTLDDRRIPMLGLSAAFIFAVQMLNFPVAGGTSGHLLGGVLAAVLVGPWAGALCVTVVLFVQALLFADGGLSALGLNVVNMAFVGAFVGYGIFLALKGWFRRRSRPSRSRLELPQLSPQCSRPSRSHSSTPSVETVPHPSARSASR